jgi:peptide deformylase
MSDQAEVTEAPVQEANVEGESPRPRPLPPEVAARRDAALKHVRRYGDPVLKTKAMGITRFDDELREEVVRMGRLMDEALGIGLAAPQVGISHRLLVYRVVQGGPLGVLVNPVIEWSSKEDEWMEEGCLSLPNVHVEVERPVHVRVAALDQHGEPQTIEASGLEARVIQHEMDHLDGVLILDRTPRGQRKEAMRMLREALAAAAADEAA